MLRSIICAGVALIAATLRGLRSSVMVCSRYTWFIDMMPLAFHVTLNAPADRSIVVPRST